MQTRTTCWRIVFFMLFAFMSFSIIAVAQTTSKQILKFKGDAEDQANYPELFDYDDQTGLPGETLARSYWVQVVDENGDGVDNFPVTFTITKGGGSIVPNSQYTSYFVENDVSLVVLTQDSGIARIRLTLGLKPLTTNQVQVTAEENGIPLGGSPLFFNAFTIKMTEFGQSLSLNGDHQYLEIPDAPYLNICQQEELTVELWFMPENIHQFNLINKIGHYGDSFSGGRVFNGWAVDFNRYIQGSYTPSAMVPNSCSLYMGRISETGMGQTTYSTDRLYNVNLSEEWIHLAVVQRWDESNSKLWMGIYANGTLILDNEWPDTIEMDGDALLIGGLLPAINDLFPTSIYFNGYIDEVRIWNFAKSRQQLVSTIVDTLGAEYYATPDSGLTAYYRFEDLEDLGVGDDGLTNDIRDLTFNQNHANAIGGAGVTLAKWFTSVENEKLSLPETFSLLQNYPNPFNPETTLKYQLSQSGYVTLNVYNVLGHQIETLVNQFQGAGTHTVTFKALNLPSGIYFGRLEMNGETRTMKMLLQK